MNEMMNTNNIVYIYIGIVALVTVVGFIGAMYSKKRRVRSAESYLETYPDAAKLYISSSGFVVSKSISVISVNGEHPAFFTEGNQLAVYVKPGVSNLVVEFSSTRPGVLHKTVTTSTGDVTIEVELDARGEYILDFDKDSEKFTVKVRD